jgi:trimeric autotransporter adhesin
MTERFLRDTAGAAACVLFLAGCGSDGSAPPAEPVISSVHPVLIEAGAVGLQLTVLGSHFTAASRARWNGEDRVTSFESATRLHVTLAAGDLAAPGTASLVIVHGTVQSAAYQVTVRNPVPALHGITPDSLLVGSPGAVVRLKGSGFSVTSEGRVTGAARQTTFIADSLLDMQLLVTDLATADVKEITVHNPAPGGGTSGALMYGASNPMPVIGSVSPATFHFGVNTTLTVTGSGFVPGSIIIWNGVLLAGTTYEAPDRLTYDIHGTMVPLPGIVQVAVRNPAPGGGTSTPVAVPVEYPAPVLTSVDPASVASDAGALTLIVEGQRFMPGVMVEIAGVTRTTQHVTAARLLVPLTAEEVAVAGNHPVIARNPGPGGGPSAAVTLQISVAPPRLTGLSPASAAAGGGSFSLVVGGRNFGEGSTVRWNGGDQSTVLGSPTALTATISAVDIAAAGTAWVSVFDPGTGLTSTSHPFTIAPPAPEATTVDSIALRAADLVHDGQRQRVYASVGAAGGQYANSIVILDPAAATVVATIPVPGDPGPLAIAADASFLYVGVREQSRVFRIDLAGAAIDAELDVSLSTHPDCTPTVADDLETLPGRPRSVVVTVKNARCSGHLGVLLFNDTVRMPRHVSDQFATSNNRVTRGLYDNEILGYSSGGGNIRRILVLPDGLLAGDLYPGLGIDPGSELVHDGGYLFSSDGRVQDLRTASGIGRISGYYFPVFAPHVAFGRFHYVKDGKLHVYHPTALTPVAELPLAYGGTPTRLIRWGSHGLALATSEALYFVRTPLAGP